MNPSRLDAVARLFATRRSRREAVALGTGTAALAAGAASLGPVAARTQDAAATPPASPDLPPPEAEEGPTTLFVQSFHRGSVAPTPDDATTYTLVLEDGLGQTIAFADRPSRDVGVIATPQFLDSLGFTPDNPPNAALVIDDGAGGTEIAVVELFNPAYDEATRTATYEARVLADWSESLELGLGQAPADLAQADGRFETAHLFIDDCPDGHIFCFTNDFNGLLRRGIIDNDEHGGYCYSWGAANCYPCRPWYGTYADAAIYWSEQCNVRFPDWQEQCRAYHVCSGGVMCPSADLPSP